MDKKLKKYFKQQYRNKKSVLAEVMDKLVSVVGVFLIVSIVTWSMGIRMRGALVIAIMADVIYIAASYRSYKKRLNDFIADVREKTARDIAYERIALDDATFKKVTDNIINKDGDGIVNGELLITPKAMYSIKLYHPMYELTANDALFIIREYHNSGAGKLNIITTARVSEKANGIISGHGGIFDKKVIDELAEENIAGQDEVDSRILKEYEQQHISGERLKEGFLSKGKARGWAACSAMLIVLGVVFNKGVLYFTAAGICGVLCGYCLLAERKEQ